MNRVLPALMIALAFVTASHESFQCGGAGFPWILKSDTDKDKDGLTNKDEKARGTNSKLSDTDGDGLADGEEVLVHNTDPLHADSDRDSLTDADEINIHKTDPTKADSDGDGLADGDEITRYKTDPLKADTDKDGLSDGEEIDIKTNPVLADSDNDGLNDGKEVRIHKTDPLQVDSDRDGLKDGEEVLTYRTDPLKADTDGGTANDSFELKQGTNPRVGEDDLPRLAIGATAVLEGVVFKSGSAELAPEADPILQKAFKDLRKHPGVKIEIQGHTDNTGSRANNLRLSQARAEAVANYLVSRGIAAERITARGYGEDKPIAPNTAAEGRNKNRRIELRRTK